jgi:PTS system fructose-specific IIA component/PTS system nitrogen regulatory IIA component
MENLFSKDIVKFNLQSSSRDEVFDELIELLFNAGKIKDKTKFREAVLEREKINSTGIGMGLAIPHAKGELVNEACIAFGRSLKGIDFDAIDGELVNFVFLIAVPKDEDALHLKVISNISRKIIHSSTREALYSCNDYDEFEKIMSE